MGNTIVANILRQAGMIVEVHSDHFRPDEEDKIWLPVVGRSRWIVLSKDNAIRRREVERVALEEARVRAFFLGDCETSGAENAKIILKARPYIERLIKHHRPPIISVVHASGRLSVIKQGASIK